MKIGRSWRLVMVLLVALAGGACSKGGSGGDSVVLVLVDVSKSSDNLEIRDRYLAYIKSIVEGVSTSGGGRILIDLVDDNPMAHSTLPVNEKLTGCDPFKENRLTCDRRVDDQRQAVIKTTEDLLGQTSQGTDILGALDVAERVFKTYPEGEKKYLVLFSDMVQSAEDLHFAKIKWDESPVSELIERAEPAPDLGGVEVYVAGAGAVKSDRLSASEVEKMKAFWLEFFERTGANLPEARYGSALIRFP